MEQIDTQSTPTTWSMSDGKLTEDTCHEIRTPFGGSIRRANILAVIQKTFRAPLTESAKLNMSSALCLPTDFPDSPTTAAAAANNTTIDDDDDDINSGSDADWEEASLASNIIDSIGNTLSEYITHLKPSESHLLISDTTETNLLHMILNDVDTAYSSISSAPLAIPRRLSDMVFTIISNAVTNVMTEQTEYMCIKFSLHVPFPAPFPRATSFPFPFPFQDVPASPGLEDSLRLAATPEDAPAPEPEPEPEPYTVTGRNIHRASTEVDWHIPLMTKMADFTAVIDKVNAYQFSGSADPSLEITYESSLIALGATINCMPRKLAYRMILSVLVKELVTVVRDSQGSVSTFRVSNDRIRAAELAVDFIGLSIGMSDWRPLKTPDGF
jgi:hypothetical protein